MREPYVEGVATHDDPDHAPVPARVLVKRWIGARAGQVLSRVMPVRGADAVTLPEGNMGGIAIARCRPAPRGRRPCART
jgi:hypothetical protein